MLERASKVPRGRGRRRRPPQRETMVSKSVWCSPELGVGPMSLAVVVPTATATAVSTAIFFFCGLCGRQFLLFLLLLHVS